MARPDLARALAKRLPRHYLAGKPWEVRLERPPTGAPGAVGWERGRWVIRLAPDLRGRDLLRAALHEVGHVVLGHPMPKDGPAPPGRARLDPLEREVLREAKRQWEEEASAWADRELPRWITGLENDL